MDQKTLNPQIVIVSESFYCCGVEVVIRQCAGIIKDRGWKDPILVGPELPDIKEENYTALPSRVVSKKRNYFRTLFFSPTRTQKVLQGVFEKADIVHIHSISLLSIRSIMLLSKMNKNREKKIKVIFHLHTQYDQYLRIWYGFFGVLLSRPIRKVINYCVGHSDLVIFPTKFYKNIFCKNLDLKTKSTVWCAPISVETNSTFSDLDYQNLLKDNDIPSDHKVLVYVGRLGTEKNIEEMFRVFTQLKERASEFALFLIGTGETDYFKNLANALQSDVKKDIVFTGHLPRDRVMDINKKAYAGISLSTTEVQGLASMEQMACGIPVVVPENTCWESQVSESGGGILVSSDLSNIDEIYEFLSDNERCKKAGAKAKEYLNKHYSAEVLNIQLVKIYESTLTQ